MADVKLVNFLYFIRDSISKVDLDIDDVDFSKFKESREDDLPHDYEDTNKCCLFQLAKLGYAPIF